MTTNALARRWQDQLILVLGLWLIAAPFVLAYPEQSRQMANAMLAGIVLVLLASLDLYKTYVWAVVINLLVGVWVAVSPWVLGVIGPNDVMWNELVVGAAVVVLALWELRTDPELYQRWHRTGTT